LVKRVLADTHVAIWFASAPELLSKSALGLLNSCNELFLSTISLAEIEMKKAKGRVKMDSVSVPDLEPVGFEIVNFDAEAASAMFRFNYLANHDPFDWLLLAQAASLDATFVTADRKLLSLGLDWVIDAEA
jgi:PIN domain nuclease of toxin-antitoxin system